MAKKVLVLGGTGAMGIYLVPELLKRNFQVFVTSRQPHKSTSKKLFYIQGDAHNLEFISKTIQANNFDVIIDFMVYSTEEFHSRYELFLKKCEQYIFLSTYRVFADDDVITERSPRLLDVIKDKEYLATDEYALAKARQEDILRASKYKNWTIVRPSITYSKNRFQLGALEADIFIWRAMRGLPVIMPREMLNKAAAMTWGGDVARLLSGLVHNKKAFGEDFNLATEQHYTWGEVVEFYKDLIDLKVRFVSVDDYIAALGGGYKKYQVNYDRMLNRVLDNSKILKITGEQQKNLLDLYDGLQRELQGFIKKPTFKGIDVVCHARIDQLTGVRMNTSGLTSEQKSLYDSVNTTLISKIRIKARLRSRLRNVLHAIKHAIRFRIRMRKATSLLREYRQKLWYRSFDGAIVTLAGYSNYGNIVQRWALQHFLKQKGYKFIIYAESRRSPENRENNIPNFNRFIHTARFIDNYIQSRPFDLERNVPGYIDEYPVYIVGSDQVWRNWNYLEENRDLGYYFLNFVRNTNATRIAYSASFGKDKVEDVMSPDAVKYVDSYIRKFDRISVREKSGIKIIKKVWNISNVSNVVDPTLLLNATNYSNLINRSDIKNKKISPIFTYILDETQAINDFIKNVQNYRKQSVMKIRAHIGAENDILPPVELWLKGFRDADLVITNSYHGMVFSVINNTEFIVIGKESGGLARVNEFLGLYGLQDRFVDEERIGQFDHKIIEKSINWDEVNKKLSQNREESANWLLDAVAKGLDRVK